MVEPNNDMLIDSNVSIHVRYCKVWKGMLFALLDANIQLSNNIVVSFIKSKWNTIQFNLICVVLCFYSTPHKPQLIY